MIMGPYAELWEILQTILLVVIACSVSQTARKTIMILAVAAAGIVAIVWAANMLSMDD